MNIRTTKLNIIIRYIILENEKGFPCYNPWLNIHKNGNIDFQKAENTDSYISYFIPALINACECRLEKKWVDSIEEALKLKLKPLKKILEKRKIK
jgi:hypothetical protein